MGLLSKIGDGVKGVFKGVVDVIDKVTGGNFSKLLGSKWVKGALMAASIMTGGIAIANGVMAAGQTGIGASVKAFATNMSAETGGNLFSKVVETGGAFVKGVASGIANPMGSDAGQSLTGFYDGAVSNLTGDAFNATDIASESASGAADKMLAQGGVDATGISGLNPNAISGTSDIAASIPEGFISAAEAPMTTLDSVAPVAEAPSMSQLAKGTPQASNVPGFFDNPALAESSMAATPDALQQAGMSAQAATTPPSSLLSKIGGGVKDFASSPEGMLTMAQMAQGWAQGKMMEERWDQLEKTERKRAASWTDGSFKMPRFAGN